MNSAPTRLQDLGCEEHLRYEILEGLPHHPEHIAREALRSFRGNSRVLRA